MGVKTCLDMAPQECAGRLNVHYGYELPNKIRLGTTNAEDTLTLGCRLDDC